MRPPHWSLYDRVLVTVAAFVARRYKSTSVLPCESISLNYYHPTTPLGDTTSIQKLLHPTTPLLLINLAYLHFRTAKRKVAILADAIYLQTKVVAWLAAKLEGTSGSTVRFAVSSHADIFYQGTTFYHHY